MIVGEIYYYCLFKGSNPTCVKLKVVKPLSENSYFGSWKIIEYLCGEPGDVGHEYSIQPGMTISGNQLLGVGVSGMAKFLMQNEKQINIFCFDEEYNIDQLKRVI